MGSLEEERLFQMVHDFIESESTTFPLSPSSSLALGPSYHDPTYLKLQGILENVLETEMDVLNKVLEFLKFEKNTGNHKKWLVMRLRVDGYETSLCTTSAGGEYEYIEVLLRDMRLIVDIDFKSQFELARPTATYKDLLNSLPQVYVGTEKKLFKIVSLMCSSAKQSYKEMELHIPPWRTTSYMQAKWQKVSKNKVENENSSSSKCIKWSPPKIKPKRPSGSALTSQFSNMGSINCC